MSTALWVLLTMAIGFVVSFWVLRVKLLGKHVFPHFTQFRSLKQKRSWWVFGLITFAALTIWWFWTELTSLHAEWFGPNFPMWGYAVGIALIIAIIWLFRMDKEARAKSFHLAEWLIGFAAVGGALIIVYGMEKEDAVCPDKQAYISVPAQGMVVDLQSCWDEEFVQLDLREVGVTELSFNAPAKVLEGRTIREFARIVTGVPGLAHGHARLIFNSSEMRKYGMTTLPVFVGPSNIQPGAQARFSDADIQALSQ